MAAAPTAARAGATAGSYDAIVVGGGHNGLVAAAYLARSGRAPSCWRAGTRPAAPPPPRRPWPDAPEFRVTRLSYVMSLLPPTIINDLDLARHGYKIYPMGPYYQAFPEGGSIKLYADDAKPQPRGDRRSGRSSDADAMPRWDAWLGRARRRARPAAADRPAEARLPQAARPASTRSGWPGLHRGMNVRTIGDVTRLMTMSIADLLDDWFESPQVKSALAVNGVIGTWAGPYEPGTAYVMAHHSIGDVGDGHLGNWGFPEGGMGAVSDAIAARRPRPRRRDPPDARVARSWSATARPAASCSTTARSSAPVDRVHAAPEDRVPGPDRPGAPAGRTSSATSSTGRPAAASSRSTSPSPNCPTSSPIPATNLQEHHTGSVEMAPSMDYIERAFLDAREGPAGAAPFSDGVIPTAFDHTLRPEGTHIMSLFTQWVPSDWSDRAAHSGARGLRRPDHRLLQRARARTSRAPSCIVTSSGPYEMEQEYGLVGGNIFHGELSLEQLFHMRPAPGYADYRTPLPGLYYGSSATHAGGGVCGIPGWQAARAAIADQKSAKRAGQARQLTRRA